MQLCCAFLCAETERDAGEEWPPAVVYVYRDKLVNWSTCIRGNSSPTIGIDMWTTSVDRSREEHVGVGAPLVLVPS